MEALLPSEIARLVFGYLEDQKCDEAARTFLEASPHLQECRTAVLSGRRFNTRVNGYTLVDIFDKFFAAHSLVQERLSKVGDCEQVRQCGDLLDQLRYLIGGSRGQRFVVNINVPSQANSQTYGGSPIITSSIRKRHHSGGSDRDRTKRTQKPLNQLFDKQPEPVSSQFGCETVEATPLESLPGHTDLISTHQHKHTATQDSDIVYCTSTKNDSTECPPLGDLRSISKQICHHPSLPQQGMEQDNSSGRSERYSPVSAIGKEKTGDGNADEDENQTSMQRGKTMATSTEELTTYSSIEVQTTPYALSESESIGLDDEPIENLSLLTKELLNRTELQERIAENINKAILPIEMPSKDESICESIGGELNTTIITELNNAIKSIVEATETDPIFEHFLDEMIGGTNIDTDTSPDEDHDVGAVATEPATNSRICDEPSNTAVVDMDIEEETAVVTNKDSTLGKTAEVPLKHRLRSSSRQQNNKIEDDTEKPKEVEKTDCSLEDHNAAAILSIINANMVGEKQVTDKTSASGSSIVAMAETVSESNELSQPVSISSESQIADSTEVAKSEEQQSYENIDKPIPRKPASTKLSNPKTKVDQNELITEQEMMAMPTLIVCSREEIGACMNVDTLYTSQKALPCPESRFIPIAPKGPEVLAPIKPLYLKAVQVPIQIPKQNQQVIRTAKVEPIKIKPASPTKVSGTNRKHNRKVTKKSKNLKPAVIPDANAVVETVAVPLINKEPTNNSVLESITLYANDNSFGTMIETGHMPAINLDDSMTLTGTGLSPYLKLHDSKNISQVEVPPEKPSEQIHTEELDPSLKLDVPIVLPHSENVLITRRTPKSLLKSRSKNNRLSLSTPRRRSSHIRALDFNTPTKSSSSEHKLDGSKTLQFPSKSSKRARSVCRTSLFKSPPFSSSFSTSHKGKSPVKDRQLYKVPIATRSPAPKLMGGWDKYTGVGMILGGTSPHPSSSTSFFDTEKPNSPAKAVPSTVKKSWDADLRQALQEHQEPTCSTFSSKKGSKTKGRNIGNLTVDVQGKETVSGNNGNCSQSKPDTNPQPPQTEIISKKINDEKLAATKDNLPDSNFETKNNSGALEQSQTVSSNKTEISKMDTKIVDKLITTDKTKEKPVVKKYAKLKTLETKISKYKKRRVLEGTASCSADSSQKNEHLKISPETQIQPSHMSRMIDLETPRKTDSSTGIPATPRLLSPSSSVITPFTKLAEELSKVPSFISTPEFPPTPSIALTPKVMGENTIDAIKKGDYGTCSPYYQPSNEQPDILEKIISGANNSKENAAEVLPATSSVNLNSRTMNESADLAIDFVMTTSSSKLEITQFEVIKGNLPKEEADKELKISTSSKNIEENLPKLENPVPSETLKFNEAETVSKQSLNDEDSSSSSGNESSDSSSSDTSSSSCSSSCSCSSIATTSTPFKSVIKCKTKSNTCRESSNDCNSKNPMVMAIDRNALNHISPIMTHEVCDVFEKKKDIALTQQVPSIIREETSPTKLMPLIKTQEEVDASAKETPAKDEALLAEANISETPSSSKSGIESLTNLNSKISALDSPGDQGTTKNSQLSNKTHVLPSTRVKPKIIGIQHFLPDVSLALKPPLFSETASSTTQPLNSLSTLSSDLLDGKLGAHLEEKRLRLMAKFKSKPTTIIPQKSSRVKQVNLSTKINYRDKRERKISTSQTASRNTAVKKVNQTLQKEEPVVTNTKSQTKQNPSDEKARVLQSKSISAKSSSKEQKLMKCNTAQSDVKKAANVDKPKSFMTETKDDGVHSKSKKTMKVEDQRAIQKKGDRRPSTETSDKNLQLQKVADPTVPQLPSKECDILQPEKTTAENKDLQATQTTKPSLPVSQNCDTTELVHASETENPELLHSCAESVAVSVENEAAVPVKKSLVIPISKVDQIKRDLFSDEENSDQRTTRSRTRHLSDVQKNEPVLPAPEPVPQTEVKVCSSVAKKPKEELASVLECLKLVPANKNEMVEKSSSTSPKSSINQSAEYEFVYDETTSVKKKRTRFRSSSLEYVINVELGDENYQECPRLMTSTNYEEIFNISPKPKKRVTAKKTAVKSSKSTKIEATKAASSVVNNLKSEIVKPLASSSPTVKSQTSIPKVSKGNTRIQQKSLKLTNKGEKKKPKDEPQILKKRKIPDTEEDQSGEKKRRIADPQSLLKKLDLDLFLNSVHGPV